MDPQEQLRKLERTLEELRQAVSRSFAPDLAERGPASATAGSTPEYASQDRSWWSRLFGRSPWK